MAINKRHDWRQTTSPREVKIVDGRAVEYSDVMVHFFKLGDVEDIDIYAADPIYQWQQTEQGQWAMENTVAPLYYISQTDYRTFGINVAVFARFSTQDNVFWKLKWGK